MILINYILRKISENLSFFYKNKFNLNLSKEYKIYKTLKIKLKNIKIKKKLLKKTHIQFNHKIEKIIVNNDLKNLLRYSFVQKIFFVHNRWFIFKELQELKKSKKWSTYKKLLVEDNACNPVRFFLYPKSSGNRIHQVYHLSVLDKYFNTTIENFKKIFEFGGGYGCLARIFYKYNNIKYFKIFDTEIVNLIQFYYLKILGCNVGFSIRNKIHLLNKIQSQNKKHDLFVANWSLSEVPLNYRSNFIPIIKNSKYILIAFQEKFEEINNLKYFKYLKNKLKKEFKILIIKNVFYKGSFLNKQNHYYLIGKKL
jgi:hypothetical protein